MAFLTQVEATNQTQPAADLLVPPLLLVSVAALSLQPVHLPSQLLGFLPGSSTVHQRLQQLQHPNHAGNHPDQTLAPKPVYDPLKLLPENRRYVVDIHDGQLGRWSL